MTITDNPNDPRLTQRLNDGEQNSVYLVLPEKERRSEHIRPLRFSYTHVGISKPQYTLRPLTDEELKRFDRFGYVAFEAYPESESPKVGRYWTKAMLLSQGCGKTTTIGKEIAETYARDPLFYGSTYCSHCRAHYPVEEFVWAGTDRRVGT